MKVAIIGGGIIGLYLAWKLSEKGVEIFLFEKKEKIGEKACSGLFSERIFDFLPNAKNLILNEIDYCLIHFPKKTIKVDFKKKFFVIDRSKLNEVLLKLAQKSGAKIVVGKNVEKLPQGFDRIIGCDGANSKIREILRLKNPVFYLGIQGFIFEKQKSNFVETWPTKEGFLWKIPRGESIEYGIMERPNRARKIFDEFLRKNDLKIENKKSALIPQGFILPKNEKITLCGDSTGLTKPWSGGGVIWSLILADFLLKNFPNFWKYQKEAKKFFSKKILFSKMIKKAIYLVGFNFPSLLPRNFKIDGDFILSDIYLRP